MIPFGTVYTIRFFSVALLFLLVLCGCDPRPPLFQPTSSELPFFTDDGDRKVLLTAARNHRSYLESLPDDFALTIGEKSFSKAALKHSIELFIAILQRTPEPFEMNSRIREHFDIFQAGGRDNEEQGLMLVTAYYEPLYQGDPNCNAPYLFPLYARPDDLTTQKDPKTGSSRTGRLTQEGIVPYPTRAEIEDGALLKGSELVCLSDPFDAYMLHVQGSGKVQLPNGSTHPVRFNGHNGHEYNSIGKLLVDEGKLRLEETSVPAIRSYLESHPEERKRIFHHNPRFIFFRWGEGENPNGSMGVPLTPNRSIAVDADLLPAGLVAYLVSERPLIDYDTTILDWIPSARFVLPQDTGGAIKGSGRVDLFLGSGRFAELSAGSMKQPGKLYFLVAKTIGSPGGKK